MGDVYGGNAGARPLSPEAAGCLLGKFGLLIVFAGVILAAWFGQTVIVIVLGLLLAAAGLSYLWSRVSLASVSCQLSLSESRVFPGEQVELKLRLVNRKLLPLPWVRMDVETPPALSPDAARDIAGHAFLSKATALLWYTGVSWKEKLRCERRGYYRLGPATLTSGDIFGFYPRSLTEPVVDHVIVYPRIYPMARLGLPSLYPLGETTATRRIFEDPTRVIGVRDYSPRDSLRRIHWKASARRQELQVKVFEPTTTFKVAVFLAVDTFRPVPGDNEDLELGISTAASIASYLVEQRSSVGLFVNSRLADSGQPVTLLPGGGTGLLVEILEALAKVTPAHSGPFEEFLPAERARLPWGTTFLFIIGGPTPSLEVLLAGLGEGGHRPVVIQIGGGEGGRAADVAWYHIGRPGDLAANAGGIE
jgi:uncharacterized protein (DUF58 family)